MSYKDNEFFRLGLKYGYIKVDNRVEVDLWAMQKLAGYTNDTEFVSAADSEKLYGYTCTICSLLKELYINKDSENLLLAVNKVEDEVLDPNNYFDTVILSKDELIGVDDGTILQLCATALYKENFENFV